MKMKASEDNSSKAVKGWRTRAAALVRPDVPMLSEEEEDNFSPADWKHRGVRDHGLLLSLRSGVSTF